MIKSVRNDRLHKGMRLALPMGRHVTISSIFVGRKYVTIHFEDVGVKPAKVMRYEESLIEMDE